MRRVAACLAVGALAAPAWLGFAVACSSNTGHLAASGEAVSCAPGMYISGGGCVQFPAFSDVITPADAGDDASDAGSSDGDADDGGSSPDAPQHADDGVAAPAEVDPLASCIVDENIFVASETTGSGRISESFTNANSTFLVKAPPPLQIGVQPLDSLTPSFALSLSGTAPPVSTLPPIGVYTTSTPEVSLALAIGGAAFTGSGTIRLDQIEVDEADGAPDHLHFVLFSFSLSGPRGSVLGCLRYADNTLPDAGAAPASDGGDAPQD